jgi:long-chain acyl-CoA synthetase
MMNVGLLAAKWARLTPDAVAIIDSADGRQVTFGEFDRMVRRLSNLLLSQGLSRGDRVAVLSQNSTEYLATYLACARVGLVTQPLNWRLAAPELLGIVQNGEPSAFVVQGKCVDVAAELKASSVSVRHWLQYGEHGDGSLERAMSSASDDEPRESGNVGDDDSCFILYTGGTTGDSKGALHTHRSVFYGMLNQAVAERIVPTDVYMLTGQMFHIPVVLALNYLSHGRPLVLMNFEPRLALELIEKHRVSAFLAVTTMLNWMLAVPDFSSFDLSSLRNIQYGGGPMPTRIIEEATQKLKCTFIHAYGQTEGTTMTVLSQEDHVAALREGGNRRRLLSCGREVYATSLRVVDSYGNDVPRDGKTPGEIIVKSPANMVGYFRRPDLTKATLRDGWMFTGDIATMDDEHFVYIVDRAKDMIISGGENIYSAQVEEAIAKHPDVLECAVIGVPDDDWGESVKAFVVLKPGSVTTEQEIIDVAKQNLASYQKPRSITFIDALPKAPTGKILKRELRAPFWLGRERNV